MTDLPQDEQPEEQSAPSAPEPGPAAEPTDPTDGTPEQTDNSVREEDGEQDVDQTPAPAEGSV